MKVVTIVAFTLLVVFAAEAGQRRHQSASAAVICDNDGRCTAFDGARTSRRKTYTAAAVILAVDALGEVAGHSTAGSGIMRGTSLAPHFAELLLECGCPSADSVSARP